MSTVYQHPIHAATPGTALPTTPAHGQCTQEPRLVHLEAALAGIANALTDVKDLLRTSIQTDERLRSLQNTVNDQEGLLRSMEKRLRATELAHAASRWAERVVWFIVAAALGVYFHNKG